MPKKNEEIALFRKGKMKIQIKLNKQLIQENGYAYRLMVNGEDILLIDSAIFYSPTKTTEELVVSSGKKFKLCYITCDSKELKVTIEPKTQKLIAHIK